MAIAFVSVMGVLWMAWLLVGGGSPSAPSAALLDELSRRVGGTRWKRGLLGDRETLEAVLEGALVRVERASGREDSDTLRIVANGQVTVELAAEGETAASLERRMSIVARCARALSTLDGGA